MTPILIDIAVILLLLLCNGFLAMTEMAIVSARKARLLQWAEAGDKSARIALEIANSPTHFLAAIQIGITLIALLTGVFGGATIADDIAERVRNSVPHLAPHSDAIGIGIVVTLLTFISVVLGELVPKRIALSAPELIAKYVALPIRVFVKIARPAVWILSSSTETVLRVLGINPSADMTVTEAEIHVMVEQATEAGVFEEVEQEMVASVLRLDVKRVGSIMTPRREIEWIDTNDTEDVWYQEALNVPHSRLPVGEGSLDRVLGIVQTRLLIKQKVVDGKIDLKALMYEPMYVPESMNALDLIQRFRENSQQQALVMDEYGGVHGIVTREDVFEAIVGELPMPGDIPRWSITRREDGSWMADGQSPIDEFKEALVIDDLPGEEKEDYRTLAGFILFHLERVPAEGEKFEWGDFEFEIVDMDRHRIDKVLIRRKEPGVDKGSTAKND